MKTENAIVAFNPKALNTYGNQMLSVLVQHEEAKEEAERALLQANERENVIDFELARVALFLHNEEKIDLYQLYAGNKDASSKLYRSILTETGVLSRNVDDETDKITYAFTDEALKGMFEFEQSVASYTFDKEKEQKPAHTDERVANEKKKRSRRNGLNIRLARVCKAALALHEAGTTPDNMAITQDDDGAMVAQITKGPSEVMGEEATIQIHSKSASPVKGATATPTITGLAKLSDTEHKEKPVSKDSVETPSNKTGDTNDMLAICNSALMAVKAKEGKFSDEEKVIMTNLVTELKTALGQK